MRKDWFLAFYLMVGGLGLFGLEGKILMIDRTGPASETTLRRAIKAFSLSNANGSLERKSPDLAAPKDHVSRLSAPSTYSLPLLRA